jgi:ABC-2 type transport system permease protein
MLPQALQKIAPIWPSYHLNQLTLSAVGLNNGALLPHVLALMGYTVILLLLAIRQLRRVG